jgi:glycosyltransferase involved in cell wall biosynthesis
VITTIEVIRGNRSIANLKDIAPTPAATPRVSVIAPARNEETKIEEALRSLLGQDYPNLEVFVVDDRSTDRTGAILDRLQRSEAGLRVVHLKDLPPGWLGKNYALYVGSQQAGGDLLLFTDADIVMDPTTVSRAVAFLLDNRLDHLTLAPQMIMPSVSLDLFVGGFSVFFSIFARPWKAKDPKSRAHIGIGAFNLVRAEVYRAVGTHQAIAMRPDDDLKLGKLIKKHGYRQDIVAGRGLVQVRWYASFGEMIDGLMKNAFSALEYSVLAVILSSAAQLVLSVWPFVAVFVTSGWTRILNLVIVLIILWLCWEAARFTGARRWFGVAFPLATLLFVYIVWRSMLVTLATGGITWRGTHYPLSALRANKV